MSATTVSAQSPGPALGSWPDWVLGRIRAAPGPSWIAYLVIFGALLVLSHAAHWLGGAVVAGTVAPTLIVEASLPVLVLAAVDSLNGVALRSLRTLRPAMTVGEAEVGEVAGQLVRTPPRWALVAGLLGIGVSTISVTTGPEGYGLRDGVGPITWLWELVMGAITMPVAFAFVAHALHQLRVVARVHRGMVRVDIFRLEPLAAFANLTSWTGITIVGFVAYGVGSLTLLAGIKFSAVDVATFGVMMAVAVAIFIAPLLGLHAQILEEKERRGAEAGQALDAAVAEVHARVRAGQYEHMDQLNNALAATTSAVLTISRTSTWPWRPETLRGFASAVGLPIFLWAMTVLLGRII